MNVGEKIRERRLEVGLSQKALGEKLGVSQQNIAQYENGKRMPKLETIKKIAAVLKISPNELLQLNGTRTIEELLEIVEIWRQQEEKLNKDNEIRHHLLIYYYNEMDRVGRDSLMKILSNLRILNDIGQREASKRVEELTEIPRYTEKET
ncbi:MAG: helix-turn-helix domain-containing protein [bacterium]|nr:helix-turn-helix domain-containing protein [bacterium]